MPDQESFMRKAGIWWGRRDRRTRLLILGGVVLAVMVAGANLSGGGGSSPPAEPASPLATSSGSGIYDNLPLDYGEIIPNESDCDTLQAIFDNAESAHDGRLDVGDVDMARAFTRTMDAADYRMEQVGCYD